MVREVHGYNTCTLATKQNTESQHKEPQVHQNIHQTPFAARSRRIHGVLGRSLGFPRSRFFCFPIIGSREFSSSSFACSVSSLVTATATGDGHCYESSMATGVSGVFRLATALRHWRRTPFIHHGLFKDSHHAYFFFGGHCCYALAVVVDGSIISKDIIIISSINSNSFAHNPHCVYPRLDH